MLHVLQKVLKQFKDKCLEQGFEIILEADVCGWLFHFLVRQPECEPHQIHLDTRVCNTKGRFDIVIGSLRSGADGRPCVHPKFVIEVKIFPRLGFTDQQHRVHYEHVLNDDLRKLGEVEPATGFRAALIVDGRGYLQGTYKEYNRRDYMIERRNQIASGVHLFIVHLADGHWQIIHEAPETELNID